MYVVKGLPFFSLLVGVQFITWVQSQLFSTQDAIPHSQ